MTMRKKDYEAIARAISIAKPRGVYEQGPKETCDIIAHQVANYCATQDPTFKRERFLADCGVQS